jgi:N-acetylneuraminic acid mutarotase
VGSGSIRHLIFKRLSLDKFSLYTRYFSLISRWVFSIFTQASMEGDMDNRCVLALSLAMTIVSVGCSSDALRQSIESATGQGSWSAKAPMRIEIGEVTVAATGGKIYVIGGTTGEVVDQKLNQEYDVATNSWRDRAPLPRGMTHAAATALNGKIYVVGAFTASGHGNAVNWVYEYDPASDTWRERAPLKSPRGSVGVTVLNGKIHAIGGRGVDKITVTTHEVYDPATNRWSELAPLPKARDHLAVVAGDAFIHVIGGRLDASSQNVDLHDIYNPATNSWQAGAPLPTARSGIAGVLYEGKIFVAGGECRDKKTYPEMEGFDLKTGHWASYAPMVKGRHGFGGVAVGRNVYYAGGATECGGGGRTNELLVFNLP